MSQPGDDKELVLGNTQLISLFFVVVALCGVFFAMGYMIGRNSGKAALADGTASAAPPPVTSEKRQQPEPPRETSAANPDTSSPDPSAQQPTVDTKPAQDTAAPQPATRTEPESKDASYIQVTALPRADADNLAKTLRDQNFPVTLSSSSKDGLFRVLVGPYHQTSQLADAKTRLKTMGFGQAFVQKQ